MGRLPRSDDNQAVRTTSTTAKSSGQAAVESAIILPLMLFMVLGIIQMTMMQQARLMTEYAAFQACRAGIVWNANPKKMASAARVALAPTVTATGLYPIVQTGKISPGPQGLLDVSEHVLAMEAVDGVSSALGFKMLDIQVIHPTRGEFDAMVAAHNGINRLGSKELDFDDVGYYVTPGTNKFDGMAGDDRYRAATRLTIRLRYMYQMRVPFADWIIQSCWFAANAPSILALHGALGRETIGPSTAVNGGDRETTAGIEAAAASAIKDSEGRVIVSKADYLALYALGRAKGWYLFPLVSTYTMRMQSNVYRSNLK
jgi:hypothetical protein